MQNSRNKSQTKNGAGGRHKARSPVSTPSARSVARRTALPRAAARLRPHPGHALSSETESEAAPAGGEESAVAGVVPDQSVLAGISYAPAAPVIERGAQVADCPQTTNAGNYVSDSPEPVAGKEAYIELPAQIPVEMPAEDDDFFDNETYRIELEFDPQSDRTKVQVRLRAKDSFRHSIVIGNYRIGRLTKPQLARAQNKTLPASIRRAIAEGDLDDGLIYRILARRGKGESGDVAQGQRKGIRSRSAAASRGKGRQVGRGDSGDEAGWQLGGDITEGSGIN